jgi:bromodomain-containing protein 7
MPYRRPRPSQPLHLLAPKVIHTIRQKDIYGFFSEPVDVTLVPDYPNVIKRPMDLGTMLKKAEEREYTDMKQIEVKSASIPTTA